MVCLVPSDNGVGGECSETQCARCAAQRAPRGETAHH